MDRALYEAPNLWDWSLETQTHGRFKEFKPAGPWWGFWTLYGGIASL